MPSALVELERHILNACRPDLLIHLPHTLPVAADLAALVSVLQAVYDKALARFQAASDAYNASTSPSEDVKKEYEAAQEALNTANSNLRKAKEARTTARAASTLKRGTSPTASPSRKTSKTIS